jgi:hypothetical protein
MGSTCGNDIIRIDGKTAYVRAKPRRSRRSQIVVRKRHNKRSSKR